MNSFELVACNSMGDFYYGGFETFFDEQMQQIQLRSFEPKLHKVLDGGALGFQKVTDIRIATKVDKMSNIHTILLIATHQRLYQLIDKEGLEPLFEKYSKSYQENGKLSDKHSITYENATNECDAKSCT